ncbi:TetR family transcriptional regulator [Streptomyces kaempferi]
MTTFQRARSEEQREIRRQAILDTAAAMLDEMSVGEVSLNELSRRVGLAKSNVLRYFESREAILLELLDTAWKRLMDELPALLAAGIDAEHSVRQRGEEFAAVFTRSLAERRVLCDLLSAQAGVLEHNVSAAVAARYKRAAIGNVDALVGLARQYLPELGDGARLFSAQAFMMAQRRLDSRPAVPGHARRLRRGPVTRGPAYGLRGTLREMVATLIVGTLTRTAS